jgi:hypothetical protein
MIRSGDICGKEQRAQAGRLVAVVVVAVAMLAMVRPRLANAQGCIVSRSTQQINGAASQSGYLTPHHWQLTIDYRHQYSFRHFVGDVEQVQRIQQGTQVENRINCKTSR